MLNTNGAILEDIIRERRFRHVFQPLYVLENWQLFGYEALLRCEFFQNPECLFQWAMAEDKLYDLDICSIDRALTSFYVEHTQLFVNAYPSTITHPSFPDFLEKIRNCSFSNRNIVLEINEAQKVSDVGLLKEKIRFLKSKKYAIALDDFGKGETSMRTVMELEPDFVKLDRFYAVDLSVSKEKQNEIQLLLEFCQPRNIYVVLEGIEEPKDLAMAKALGIHLGQGYLLGKPSPVRGVN
ncbi:EAL domain-containing protein [Anoxybacillus rupiensis]|uniref:EAL domain-containing protein n=1 Tax=Anoxybacteroides rupiense TaxID=311460 RepID=A0ABD5IYN2_9BACL|nr:EAL domain-containing protein [Anoxybacillus rupiensis]